MGGLAKLLITLTITGGVFVGGISAASHYCPNWQCINSSSSVPTVPDSAPVNQAPVNQAPVNAAPVAPAAVADTYLHFSCGSSRQCAQVIGYNYGIDPAAFYAMTKAQCDNLVRTNAMGMTPWNGSSGTWCSTNRQPSTQPP